MSSDRRREQWHLGTGAEDERRRLAEVFAEMIEPVAAAIAASDAENPDTDPELVTPAHVRQAARFLLRFQTADDAVAAVRLRHDIFISYQSDDAPFANEVRDKLTKKGLTVFLAEASIAAGRDWEQDIFDALAGSSMPAAGASSASRSVTVAAALVSDPPPVVPPLSIATNVN
jgi:hypothetical protein